MKKETVNVFDGGLNKDLNPLVTPNNVLTDNLNGTFLTFNGDELSLQNDAGNTTIPVSDTEPDVKLSPGFYPIGMKEYGGVLYIVSGKKGVNEDGTRNPELDEIEFGSYPSPANAGYTSFLGEVPIYLRNTSEIEEENDIFYKSFVINTDYFKTGRFIQFSAVQTGLNLNHVWNPWDHQRIYVIKLLLKLDNGSIDLTEDIWHKFEYHKNSTNDPADHWLASSTFIYHCPFSYKGRLVIRTEINEPSFDVVQYHDIVPNSEGNYVFQLGIRTQKSDALEIIGYEINITTDTGYEISDFDDSYVASGTYTTRKIIIPQEAKIMHYSIHPILKYVKTGARIEWIDFPTEFKNKYTVKNYVLLQEKYYNIGFNIEESECDPNTGKRSIKVLSLINDSGYIAPDLTNNLENGLAYIYYQNQEGYTLKNAYNKLGTFDVDLNTGLPININTTANISDQLIKSSIENKLKEMQVLIEDSSCAEAIITIEFSTFLPMISPSQIRDASFLIFQDGTPGAIPYESYDSKSFTVKVNATKNVNIVFEKSGFSTIRTTILKGEIQTENPYKLGLITDFSPNYRNRMAEGAPLFNFASLPIDSEMEALVRYISDKSDTTVPIEKRIRIVRDDASIRTYEILESLKILRGPSNSYVFVVYVEDNELWNTTRSAYYYYKFVVPSEYLVLNDEFINVPNATKYVKLGNEKLGYILFNSTGTLIVADVDLSFFNNNNLWL